MQLNDYLHNLARNEDEKRLIARICELVFKAAQGSAAAGDFLDLRQQELARAVAVNEPSVAWLLEGGFTEAERKRLLVYPEWETQPDPRIACLCIQHKAFREISLGHRDYLGAILNLGIKREKLGDIVVQSDRAFLFLDLDLSAYLCQQLNRVKNASVWAELIDPQEIVWNTPEQQTIQRSLASLRLDAAVAAAYNLSRAEVELAISRGYVKLNQLAAEKAAALVKAGDLVSVRGQGRFRLERITGVT
ncbi:MAG: RNA-binding protein, partial [Methanobacterium sp.]